MPLARNVDVELPSFGVLLPTYNEAGSITIVVDRVVRTLQLLGQPYEILVVDDASPDGTADLVAHVYADLPTISVLRHQPPRGLGVSIADGLLRMQARVIVVMDADLNHDPADIPRLLDALEGVDLVSGSRFVPGGGMYSRVRWAGSWMMNLLIRGTLRTGMRDNLSGFFAARRSFLLALPREQIFHGYGDFYFRLLALARRGGAHLREIPVSYPPRVAGKSKTPLVATAARYAWRLLRFALGTPHPDVTRPLGLHLISARKTVR